MKTKDAWIALMTGSKMDGVLFKVWRASSCSCRPLFTLSVGLCFEEGRRDEHIASLHHVRVMGREFSRRFSHRLGSCEAAHLVAAVLRYLAESGICVIWPEIFFFPDVSPYKDSNSSRRKEGILELVESGHIFTVNAFIWHRQAV